MEQVMCIHQYFNDKTGRDECAWGLNVISCQACRKLPGNLYQPVKTEDEERRREQKENFMMIYHDIERPGAAELLKWLQTTDLFTAPASTKYHGAYPGGLLDHILDVYYRMFPEAQQAGYDTETIAVVALLHDVCKLNVYKETEWEGKTLYKYHDDFPLGHGEKSIVLILKYMELTVEEMLAINWHMGAFDSRASTDKRSLNDVFDRYKLAVLLHIADMQATFLDDCKKGGHING